MRVLEILVVDDERDLASGIVEMLEAEGHRVVLASSGEAAIEEARAPARWNLGYHHTLYSHSHLLFV